jgi:hypothetical protein
VKKARRVVTEIQNKLKGIQTAMGKKEHSVESKMFHVLKNIGVELSSYHGGSLNGKDIKKIMNNATHIFEMFALILEEGKRQICVLSEKDINGMCLHFREVFVLWDGAFSLARTVNPMEQDIKTYQRYVNAAVQGNALLRCTVTPKVHYMLKHVAWQMENIEGGLGDKMEDWVERLHQTGMRLRQQFRTVQNPIVRADARERASSRSAHPDVIAHTNATSVGNKRSLSTAKSEDTIAMGRKRQRDMGRFEAMQFFEKEGKMDKLTWSVVAMRRQDASAVHRVPRRRDGRIGGSPSSSCATLLLSEDRRIAVVVVRRRVRQRIAAIGRRIAVVIVRLCARAPVRPCARAPVRRSVRLGIIVGEEGEGAG